jgi:hypothetical protein
MTFSNADCEKLESLVIPNASLIWFHACTAGWNAPEKKPGVDGTVEKCG